MDRPIRRYPDISDVASAMECTGLMQTPPADGYDYESYQELYDMEIPKQATGWQESHEEEAHRQRFPL